jgi:hypothetical protein
MSKVSPEEVSELVESLKKGGFEVLVKGDYIAIKGQLKLMYKKDNNLHIEIDYKDLKLVYMEIDNKTSIMLLKFGRILTQAEGVKVTEYDILKVMDFNRKFEISFDTDAFGIRG